MFYCEQCRKKNEWPEGFAQSRGPCECCDEVSVCHDIPSSNSVFVKEVRMMNFEEWHAKQLAVEAVVMRKL